MSKLTVKQGRNLSICHLKNCFNVLFHRVTLQVYQDYMTVFLYLFLFFSFFPLIFFCLFEWKIKKIFYGRIYWVRPSCYWKGPGCKTSANKPWWGIDQCLINPITQYLATEYVQVVPEIVIVYSLMSRSDLSCKSIQSEHQKQNWDQRYISLLYTRYMLYLKIHFCSLLCVLEVFLWIYFLFTVHHSSIMKSEIDISQTSLVSWVQKLKRSKLDMT